MLNLTSEPIVLIAKRFDSCLIGEDENDGWCPDCPACIANGRAHLKGHALDCQCEVCYIAWFPQTPPESAVTNDQLN